MYVWTSVIGVIIAALSLGYWLGGITADRRHRLSDVALLLAQVLSVAVASCLVVYPDVLQALANTELGCAHSGGSGGDGAFRAG